MRRKCRIEEIWDGKFYELNETAKLNCDGCRGKAKCCHNMGNSIILDPFDVHRISSGMGWSQEQVMSKVELNVVDGLILPNLKMEGDEDACMFLNEEGRCSIHSVRPGICRIFPLARIYEEGDFKFFLQKEECPCQLQTVRKINTWIETPDFEKNKKMLLRWHYFLNDMENYLKNKSQEEQKMWNIKILKLFYYSSWKEDFYTDIEERILKIEEER